MSLLSTIRNSEGCELSTEDNLEKRLLRDFKYPFSRVLFIWCPLFHVDPGVVATMLGSYDQCVRINNHWISSSSSSPTKVWSGALAKFSSEKLAKTAAESIPKKFRFFKLLPFKEIMDILMDAERSYPTLAKEKTKVIFKGNFALEEEQAFVFRSALKKFGNPKRVILYSERTEHGVIAVAKYSSQFQAYAAKIAMDGTLVNGSGFVSSEISLTENEKKFDNFVRYRFRYIADKWSRDQENILKEYKSE